MKTLPDQIAPRTLTELTAQELVSIGELDDSEDGLVQDVAALVQSDDVLQSELTRQTDGLVSSFAHPILGRLNQLQISLGQFSGGYENPHGFGYISSSTRHNPEKEKLFAALVTREVRRAGLHPLVLPIDAFYAFNNSKPFPYVPSMIIKTRMLGEQGHIINKKDQKINAVVLTGITDSLLFDEDTLRMVPAGDVTNVDGTFRDFVRRLPQLAEQYGGIHGILRELIKRSGGKTREVKLVFCSALLAQESREWAKLSYTNIPLLIVAPKTFHDALNRVSFFERNDYNFEYALRARLMCQDVPPFNTNEDGAVELNLDTRPPLIERGVGREVFERVVPLLQLI